MEDLRIYQISLSLISEIYNLTNSHKSLSRDFALVDQIRRAAISIISNIAEGYYRTRKESVHYLRISSGSTNEVVAQLQIINLVYKIDTITLQEQFKQLGKQINSYSNSVKNRN